MSDRAAYRLPVLRATGYNKNFTAEAQMPHYFFVWTPEIIEHLAEHDVTPEEFEEVVSHPDNEDISRSTRNPLAFGLTSEGRSLCCVFKRLDEDTIEPVTAYEVGE